MASDMSAQDWKIVSLFLLLLLVWFGGMIPTQLGRLSSDPRVSAFILALGNAFSGGVFLCVALAHLLPDAVEELKDLSHDVPVASLLALLGFLIVFFVEKILMGGQHDDEVVAVTAAARAKHQHVDLIVVPRRVIPHYSTLGRIKDEAISEEAQAERGVKRSVRRHTWHEPNKGVNKWMNRMKQNKEYEGIPGKSYEGDDVMDTHRSNGSSVAASPQISPFPPRITKVHIHESKEEESHHHHADVDGAGIGSVQGVDAHETVSHGDGNKHGHGHGHGHSHGTERATLLHRTKERTKSVHEEAHEQLLDDIFHAEGGHHHHIDLSTGRLVPYILALVLSIHSFIEGIALGVQSDASQTIVILIAIASHKWIEAFAFGASFVKEKVPLRRWIGILALYSVTTPLGIVAGLLLSNYLKGNAALYTEGATEALAVGTFLYVAIMDILSEEFEDPGPWKKRYSMFAAMLVGIGVIAAVLFWDPLSKKIL